MRTIFAIAKEFCIDSWKLLKEPESFEIGLDNFQERAKCKIVFKTTFELIIFWVSCKIQCLCSVVRISNRIFNEIPLNHVRGVIHKKPVHIKSREPWPFSWHQPNNFKPSLSIVRNKHLTCMLISFKFYVIFIWKSD